MRLPPPCLSVQDQLARAKATGRSSGRTNYVRVNRMALKVMSSLPVPIMGDKGCEDCLQYHAESVSVSAPATPGRPILLAPSSAPPGGRRRRAEATPALARR
eukprot:scaffold417_cov31-Prasinocladus_malaysianus.AAC.1